MWVGEFICMWELCGVTPPLHTQYYTHQTQNHTPTPTEATTQEGADRLALAAAGLVYDLCGGVGDRPSA